MLLLRCRLNIKMRHGRRSLQGSERICEPRTSEVTEGMLRIICGAEEYVRHQAERMETVVTKRKKEFDIREKELEWWRQQSVYKNSYLTHVHRTRTIFCFVLKMWDLHAKKDLLRQNQKINLG